MPFPIECGLAEFALIIGTVDRLRRFLASRSIYLNEWFDANGLTESNSGNTWASDRWYLKFVYSNGRYNLTLSLTITAYPTATKEMPHSIQPTFVFYLTNESTQKGIHPTINRETGYFEPNAIDTKVTEAWVTPFVKISENLKTGKSDGQSAEKETFVAIAELLSA